MGNESGSSGGKSCAVIYWSCPAVGKAVATGEKRDRQDRPVARSKPNRPPARPPARPPSAETRLLVRRFAVFGAAISLIIVVFSGPLGGGWLAALLASIAVSMSDAAGRVPGRPDGIHGNWHWRISRARVPTRRRAAIETLSSATVLCTDKTRTVTENHISVCELRLVDGAITSSVECTIWRLPALPCRSLADAPPQYQRRKSAIALAQLNAARFVKS